MPRNWISKRSGSFDSSGIRKVFELAKRLENPIDLSIGQPDFDVPPNVRQAAIDAISSRKNGYSLTQGIAELIEKLQARIDERYQHEDRKVIVTSGTSGGLVLSLLALLDPCDEVIIFDPFFVEYPALVGLFGGTAVFVDTYPDFRIDAQRLRAAITPRTKAILFNSPANPTGVVAHEDEVRQLAEIAAEHNVALVSDEIYRDFSFDASAASPASTNPDTIVIEGFSKTYGMTGWRIGFAHGPAALIDEMIKLQQYTFVCAPHPLQWGALSAMDVDMSDYRESYRRKRDIIWEGLREDYELVRPEGAFYAFPRTPWGTATEFVAKAIEANVLIIPGSVFSARDTHFRISYAADDAVLERGVDALRELAAKE